MDPLACLKVGAMAAAAFALLPKSLLFLPFFALPLEGSPASVGAPSGSGGIASAGTFVVTGQYGGATTEAKVTNTITAAKAAGATFVWVPASMLPYNSSLVAYDTSIRMIREGGNPAEWDVEAYGAGASLASFLGSYNTPGFQAAIDGQHAAGGLGSPGVGVVRIPRNQYAVNTLNFYSNTTIKGYGVSYGGTGGSNVVQSAGIATPILQPATPGSITQGFLFEDFIVSASGNANNTGGVDCTNCFGFTLRNVVVSSTLIYGVRVVGGPVAGNSGFGRLIGCGIVSLQAGAYALQFSGTAVDQPDGMTITDCYVGTTVGTWVKFDSAVGGKSAGTCRFSGCQFECGSGSATADLTYDVRGGGPNYFEGCRFENVGTGGIQVNLQGFGVQAAAQFVNCTWAPGAGGLTWTDAGPVFSSRILDLAPAAGGGAMVLSRFISVEDGSRALVSGVTPAIDVSNGNYFTLAILTNIAVVVAVPTNGPLQTLPLNFSKEITIAIRNASGGALTTPATFNAGANGFKFNGTVSPANGLQVEVKFRWDPVQSFWYEIARGAAL